MIWLLACLHRGAPVEPAPRPTSAPISHVARAHYLAAHVHIARGNLEAAASSYKRAVLFDDDAPRLYLELGQLRLLQGDPEAALAWLDEAIALGADAPAHLSRAQALFELGRLDEAENIWKGTPPSPERAPLSLQLGYPRRH